LGVFTLKFSRMVSFYHSELVLHWSLVLPCVEFFQFMLGVAREYISDWYTAGPLTPTFCKQAEVVLVGI
jgi:hypothetical protein